MSYRGDWSRAGRAVLDGSGNGSIVIEPQNAWQTITIEHVVVSTSQPAGSLPVPTVKIYLNSETDANLHGGTRNGDLDTGRGRIVMGPVDVIRIRFTGGRPGDVASAIVHGTVVSGA